MSLPDYQTFLLPVLQHCSDGQEHHIQEIYQSIAEKMNLPEEELEELLPSGRQTIYENRIAWARTYLKKAGLLNYPKRGSTQITERGRKVLNEKRDFIDRNYLMTFPEFAEFQNKDNSSNLLDETKNDIEKTLSPQEIIEAGFNEIHKELISEVLELLKSQTPQKFEKIVVELLVKMGYGGTLKDAGQAIGKSGDGGIDGIIKEDRLGLEKIYIQAKRWEGNVSRPEIQKFAGALHMNSTDKGVFLTTSDYTKEAYDCANQIRNTTIILINGDKVYDRLQFRCFHRMDL